MVRDCIGYEARGHMIFLSEKVNPVFRKVFFVALYRRKSFFFSKVVSARPAASLHFKGGDACMHAAATYGIESRQGSIYARPAQIPRRQQRLKKKKIRKFTYFMMPKSYSAY